jgi:CBS domain-containing protein
MSRQQVEAPMPGANRPVRDIMVREVLCLHRDDTVGTALTALLARDLSGAPVVDEKGHPVGVLSIRDVIGKGTGATAGDRMSAPPVTIAEEATVAVAARLIGQTRVSVLVVVSREGRVGGAVTPTDVLRALVSG